MTCPCNGIYKCDFHSPVTIEARRTPADTMKDILATHRIKGAVIEPPSIVIMNYCSMGGIIPKDDLSRGIVWRPIDCT